MNGCEYINPDNIANEQFGGWNNPDAVLKAALFVGTDSPMINVQRIASRYLKGGHEVPISKIISRYDKAMVNAAEVATFVDRMCFYDNSITLQDGVIPEWTPLFRTENGKIVDKYPRPNHLWARIIYDELKA